MGNLKSLACRAALLLVLGCQLVCGTGPSWAQESKSEPAGKGGAAAAPVKVPEITRIAVFQNERGGQTLGSPLALALDEQNGDIMVTSFESGELVVLDKNGVQVKRLGRDAGLLSPYGVAVDAKGRIYVSELQSGLLKILSPSGTALDEIDLSQVMGKKVTPGRITLDQKGLIYVADLNHYEILVVNGKGEFVRALGPFDYLQKGGTAGDGRIIGLSAQGQAVKVFSSEGGLLYAFGHHGDSSDRNMSFPTGFALDARGRIWIADAFQHRLKVFAPDGSFLFNFGRMEQASGGFFFPVDLCFNGSGRLFVLEKGAHRIQVFRIADLGE